MVTSIAAVDAARRIVQYLDRLYQFGGKPFEAEIAEIVERELNIFREDLAQARVYQEQIKKSLRRALETLGCTNLSDGDIDAYMNNELMLPIDMRHGFRKFDLVAKDAYWDARRRGQGETEAIMLATRAVLALAQKEREQ